MNGHFGLPGGKVEKDENFIAATIREANEETGTKLKPEDLKLILTGQRKHPDSNWVDVVFEAQSWSGEPFNAEPDIHGELVWLDPDHLPDNMVPYTRIYIEQIQAGNNYVEYGWQ
jgi:ADP-ribose pyrophosphatase YjhB (NUDIX family)